MYFKLLKNLHLFAKAFLNVKDIANDSVITSFKCLENIIKLLRGDELDFWLDVLLCAEVDDLLRVSHGTNEGASENDPPEEQSGGFNLNVQKMC